MKITRTDPLTGRINTRDLPVADEQIARWKAGAFVQDAFPHLSAYDREFIKTGIMPDTWDSVFALEEEE